MLLFEENGYFFSILIKFYGLFYCKEIIYDFLEEYKLYYWLFECNIVFFINRKKFFKI